MRWAFSQSPPSACSTARESFDAISAVMASVTMTRQESECRFAACALSLQFMPSRGLGDVDPLTVPLPTGTEVTTRVDRVVGERRVLQGAVGRVIAADGDEL